MINKTIVSSGSRFPEFQSNKKACLVIISGQDIGKIIQLSKKHTIIGRSDTADITIDDPGVSRQHTAIIIESKDTIILKDLNSTNGTQINYQKITESPLKDDDKIIIANTVIKFIYKDLVEADFHEEIYKLASLDGLTQLINKKHFKEVLSREISRSQRQKEPLALCMMDIDFFKKINDTHGHQAGDHLLVEVTKLIKQQIRKEDVFARYGGEEFCLLLPNSTHESAYTVAEKIRQTIAETTLSFNNKAISVTLSIGIAMLQNASVDGDHFIEYADAKLYHSKQNGRNQVSI